MNSGIRFSVALIVVVVVLLGLYYAGLDDEDQTGGGSTPPVEVAAVPDGTPETTPAAPREEIPATPTETVPVQPVPEAVEEATPSTEPEPTEFDEYPASMGDGTSDADMPSTDLGPSTSGSEESLVGEAEEIETPDESVDETAESSVTEEALDAASGTPSEDAADAEDAETAGAPDDARTTGDDATSGSTDVTPARGGPGRPANAGGVGIHRLASISREPELATSAMRAISRAESPGVIPGPSRSAWIPVPPGTDDVLLADAIVGRVPGDDTIHMLVLTDDANAVDLAGRVASTTINGSRANGAWQVQFRPTAEALEIVRNGTRPQVGAAVAWIGDGRAIVVHRPVLPVSGRGVVPTTCRSEAEAEAIVAALERRADPPTSTAGSTPGSTQASRPAAGPAPRGRSVVNGAGSLPPEMYTTYIVKPGDNFEKIAAAWFGDRSKSSLIAEANPYAESSRLSVGQELRLPPKDLEFETEIPGPDPATGVRVYRIRSGDTLGKIAQRVYGKASEWPRIHEANKDVIGENPGNLRVGMEIILP